MANCQWCKENKTCADHIAAEEDQLKKRKGNKSLFRFEDRVQRCGCFKFKKSDVQISSTPREWGAVRKSVCRHCGEPIWFSPANSSTHGMWIHDTGSKVPSCHAEPPVNYKFLNTCAKRCRDVYRRCNNPGEFCPISNDGNYCPFCLPPKKLLKPIWGIFKQTGGHMPMEKFHLRYDADQRCEVFRMTGVNVSVHKIGNDGGMVI